MLSASVASLVVIVLLVFCTLASEDNVTNVKEVKVSTLNDLPLDVFDIIVPFLGRVNCITLCLLNSKASEWFARQPIDGENALPMWERMRLLCQFTRIKKEAIAINNAAQSCYRGTKNTAERQQIYAERRSEVARIQSKLKELGDIVFGKTLFNKDLQLAYIRALRRIRVPISDSDNKWSSLLLNDAMVIEQMLSDRANAEETAYKLLQSKIGQIPEADSKSLPRCLLCTD